MNKQLALTIELNQQAYLNDFCWGANSLLKQHLEQSLQGKGERIIYIWGPPGNGKSHLLQGCCQALAIPDSSTAIYLPLQLLKEWGPASIENLAEYPFIAIDDIDVIAGESPWEEALFHLYNQVRDNGQTFLLMSGQDAPTASTIQLPDLRSRLTGGLVLQLQELSDELKILTLQQQAHKRGFILSSQVAFFLINRCTRNMHDLQKILDQLDQASLIAQRKITLPFVKEVLSL